MTETIHSNSSGRTWSVNLLAGGCFCLETSSDGCDGVRNGFLTHGFDSSLPLGLHSGRYRLMHIQHLTHTHRLCIIITRPS